MYSHVQVSNDARLHLGDSITINNNYHGDSKEADEEVHFARVEITHEFLMTLSAAVGLVRALLQTTTGFLILLQFAMSACQLPKQISDELAVFEDALGNFQRINLKILDSWPEFQRRLEFDFKHRPGSRRILEMRYRLSDRVGGDYLVDPRHPPPFASVFTRGRHVQMSILFEWSEVCDKRCPRCGVVQECKPDAETICTGCGFSYRGHVDVARVEELDDEATPLPEDNDDAADPPRPESGQKGRDMPSYFSRITISKQPIYTCGNCSRGFTRFDQLKRHSHTHSGFQSGDTSTESATVSPNASVDDLDYCTDLMSPPADAGATYRQTRAYAEALYEQMEEAVRLVQVNDPNITNTAKVRRFNRMVVNLLRQKPKHSLPGNVHLNPDEFFLRSGGDNSKKSLSLLSLKRSQELDNRLYENASILLGCG
jgi:hypothetical protein